MTSTTRSAKIRQQASVPPQATEPTSGIDGNVNVADYVDVEAEHDSDPEPEPAEDDNDAGSLKDWVVSDGVDPSVYDSESESSDTMSASGEFPPTLTGPVSASTSEPMVEDPVHIGTVDVKGKSVAVPVPVNDKTDVNMSEEATHSTVSGDATMDDATNTGDTAKMEGVIAGAHSLSMNEAGHGAESKEHDQAITNLYAAIKDLPPQTVADLFSAVKEKRPAQHSVKTHSKPHKGDTKTTKKPEPTQTTLELEKKKEVDHVTDEQFSREDGVPIKGQFLRRLVIFTTFANSEESMFYVRNEPRDLAWSSQRARGARLIVSGQATPVRLMVIGQISWNGMLPLSRGDNGPIYPTKPKVAIKCLRDGDFLHVRNIIKDYSNSKLTLELQNMSSVLAYTDCSVQIRGQDKPVGVPFPRVYDGEKKYSANKSGMPVMQPNQLLRNDIVLLEMSVGKYYDIFGKQMDWNSTRVYFNLEAVTLLLRHDSKAKDNGPTPSSSKVEEVSMDVSM
ncbi:unnamed protein product [Peniophora sp. CBMAI 1063]|nr:unnamed protein product [Peniophora sp. CBMAI 1063]